MKYRLQEGRYAENWQDVDDYPRDASNLEAWIDIGENQETHEGRYHFRIVDENDAVVWTKTPPYGEGVHINLADASHGWLEEIRRDYLIPVELFKAACEAWLADGKNATDDE